MEMVRNNQCVVLVGETGSGKTTQVMGHQECVPTVDTMHIHTHTYTHAHTYAHTRVHVHVYYVINVVVYVCVC